MRKTMMKRSALLPGWMAIVMVVMLGTVRSEAAITGITGTTFNLTAKETLISLADGASLRSWGYANGTGPAQLPGPTLKVNQNATITINLTNQLTVPVSLVFPGQSNVTAVQVTAPTQDGLLTKEAKPGGTVRYTFTVSQPGTFTYHSGTNPDLQVEMGLSGAIIVRPTGYITGNHATYKAYGHAGTAYDREFLLVLSEMDWNIHYLVDTAQTANVDNTSWWPVYWFINGRTAPDTMLGNNVPWLPSQPYSFLPRFYPGERVLLRIIGGGRDHHPFHTHGNHCRIIARDGRLLTSDPANPLLGADLATNEFTVTSVPGGTADCIFQWTGAGLGWDFYGHAPGDPLATNECPGGPAPGNPLCDHGKPFPVLTPSVYDIVPGMVYSGSPFLGAFGFLPPGQGMNNMTGGFFFMWHSHNEAEIVNFNIFPGGMLTMVLVDHPSVPIPPE
jgi:FtsP/CotA-like multicopper oxidase with cupredoxin domain